MTKRQVRVVKKHQRTGPKRAARSAAETKRTKSATGIKSWVAEFQQRERIESLPSFDSLFNELLPNQEGPAPKIAPLFEQAMENQKESDDLRLT